MNHLCISVRWFDERYHGRGASGGPEWPPSPLRLFQALLATAFSRDGDKNSIIDSFRWLGELAEPAIVAPRASPGRPYTRFVPNNDSDRVFERQNRLAAKHVCPTLLLDSSPIHYLWPLPKLDLEAERRITFISDTASRLVAFGWGIDMATATATVISESEVEALLGEHWRPASGSAHESWRVPTRDAVQILMARYGSFINRLQRTAQMESGYFTDLPPLDQAAFRLVRYKRATDGPTGRFAAFQLLKDDASGYRAFDTVRQGSVVAGMLRNATKGSAQAAGWPDDKIAAFVLGHREANGEPHRPVGPNRFSFIPLPSIEARGEGRAAVVGRIRRALVAVMVGDHEEETEWASRAMSGMELIDEQSGQPSAILSLIPRNEKIVQRYLRASEVWSTVTPLVLPGYDDPSHYRRRLKRGTAADEKKRLLEHLESRTDGLIRKAIVQAGFSAELAEHAEIDWRDVGFWPGCELAMRYTVPVKLRRFPRLHVRIHWKNARGEPVRIAGPVCIGGGRYIGLGLFAPELT